MFILTKDRPENSLDEWKRCWEQYAQHLRGIQNALPSATREFAEAPWHYDHLDHRAPHDAWVRSVNVADQGLAESTSRGAIEISISLLGAYHDRVLTLEYVGVERHDIISGAGGYGDWLYDEIRLSQQGLVLHEVEFSNGSWIVECKDLRYTWHPLLQHSPGEGVSLSEAATGAAGG